jgi:hypothetical protein
MDLFAEALSNPTTLFHDPDLYDFPFYL